MTLEKIRVGDLKPGDLFINPGAARGFGRFVELHDYLEVKMRTAGKLTTYSPDYEVFRVTFERNRS